MDLKYMNMVTIVLLIACYSINSSVSGAHIR